MFYSFNPSISPREFYKTETFPPVTQDTNVVVVWSCPTLSNPMDCSMPGFLVLHYLQEFSQTHALWAGDAIQPSLPLSSTSSLSLNLSQHQCLFQWASSLHQVAKVLELQLQYQSFQWIFSVYFLKVWLVWSPWCPRDSQESSPTPQFESTNSSALSLLYSPTLTCVHDYWKKHSFDYMDICQQSDVSASEYAV